MMEIKSLKFNYRMEVPIGKDPRFSPFPQKHSRKITLPSPPAVCFLSRQRAAFFVSGWKTGHHTYQFLTIRRYYFMAFFASAIDTLQILVVALGAGLGAWGVINLLEGYGNDNRATCS